VDLDLFSDESKVAPPFLWSQVEATGEIKFKDKRKRKAKAYLEPASYTGFLLQARPDLVSVLGIFVEPKEFRLLASNACGVHYMEPVRWDAPNEQVFFVLGSIAFTRQIPTNRSLGAM
jgi:hypothetical protein